MSGPPPGTPPGAGEGFHTTRWTVVLAAGQASGEAAERALAALVQAYWYPLFLFIRRSGHPEESARDLVQSFFLRLLERGTVGQAAAERGRFRSYLVAQLKHFLIDDWRHAARGKRGDGEHALSLSLPGVQARAERELNSGETPATLFDQAWAAALLERAVARLTAECDGDGNAGRFAVLKEFLLGGRGEVPLDEAARSLGLSLAAVKSVVHRLRQRFREIVREEVSETLGPEEDVDAELRWLAATLARHA